VVVGLRRLSAVGEAVDLVVVFCGFWVVLGVVAGSPLPVVLAPQAAVRVVGAPHHEDDGPQPLAPFLLKLVRLHRDRAVRWLVPLLLRQANAGVQVPRILLPDFLLQKISHVRLNSQFQSIEAL
jgi:hypothetical protein